MQLSQNFTLDEFLFSQTAERYDIDMTPSDEVIANLERLARDFLQPIREAANAPVRITSGFRPLELNTRIGGSETSAHIEGRAADFVVIGQEPIATCRMIRDMELDLDQLIHEFGRWVHLGIADHPRHEYLTAYRRNRKTAYVTGIRSMEELQ